MQPDIQYAVSQINRFMHSPGTKHWQAAKWVFLYLKGTMDFCLLYGEGNSSTITAFTDSDGLAAHIFTKVPSRGKFEYFRKELGILPTPG